MKKLLLSIALLLSTPITYAEDLIIQPTLNGRFKVSYDTRNEENPLEIAHYSSIFSTWGSLPDNTNARIVAKHRKSPACIVEPAGRANTFKVTRLKWTDTLYVAKRGMDLGTINASSPTLNTTKQSTFNFYCGSIEDSGKVTIISSEP